MSKSNFIVTQKQPRIYFDKLPQHKLTHLLYVDDLKTYHKTPIKAMIETRRMESMFSDIGLEWGLDKWATVTVTEGKTSLLMRSLPSIYYKIKITASSLESSESWRTLHN